jgi:hypothetical protein
MASALSHVLMIFQAAVTNTHRQQFTGRVITMKMKTGG